MHNAVCPGWTYSGLHCYRLFTYDFLYSDRTWTTAAIQCRTHGGRLVSIQSANEAYAINNILRVSIIHLVYGWFTIKPETIAARDVTTVLSHSGCARSESVHQRAQLWRHSIASHSQQHPYTLELVSLVSYTNLFVYMSLYHSRQCGIIFGPVSSQCQSHGDDWSALVAQTKLMPLTTFYELVLLNTLVYV